MWTHEGPQYAIHVTKGVDYRACRRPAGTTMKATIYDVIDVCIVCRYLFSHGNDSGWPASATPSIFEPLRFKF